jgi:hypothetical protein
MSKGGYILQQGVLHLWEFNSCRVFLKIFFAAVPRGKTPGKKTLAHNFFNFYSINIANRKQQIRLWIGIHTLAFLFLLTCWKALLLYSLL